MVPASIHVHYTLHYTYVCRAYCLWGRIFLTVRGVGGVAASHRTTIQKDNTAVVDIDHSQLCGHCDQCMNE